MHKHSKIDNALFVLAGVVVIHTAVLLASCNDMTGSAARAVDAGEDSPQQRVDYEPIPMDRLIATTELIVVGRVEDVGADRVAFRIEDNWSRPDQTGVILVEQVELPEILAARPSPYTRGQAFVLFLNRSAAPRDEQTWQIAGTPIIGAIAIDEQYAYIDSYDLDGFDFLERQVHGATRNAQRIGLQEFKDAVVGYRTCFSWNLEQRTQNNKVRSRWVVSGNCDDGAVRQYRQKSSLHEYLAASTLRQIPSHGGNEQ